MPTPKTCGSHYRKALAGEFEARIQRGGRRRPSAGAGPGAGGAGAGRRADRGTGRAAGAGAAHDPAAPARRCRRSRCSPCAGSAWSMRAPAAWWCRDARSSNALLKKGGRRALARRVGGNWGSANSCGRRLRRLRQVPTAAVTLSRKRYRDNKTEFLPSTVTVASRQSNCLAETSDSAERRPGRLNPESPRRATTIEAARFVLGVVSTSRPNSLLLLIELSSETRRVPDSPMEHQRTRSQGEPAETGQGRKASSARAGSRALTEPDVFWRAQVGDHGSARQSSAPSASKMELTPEGSDEALDADGCCDTRKLPQELQGRLGQWTTPARASLAHAVRVARPRRTPHRRVHSGALPRARVRIQMTKSDTDP